MKQFINMLLFIAVIKSAVMLGFIIYETIKEPEPIDYASVYESKGTALLLLAQLYHKLGHDLINEPFELSHHQALRAIQPAMHRAGVPGVGQVEMLNAWQKEGGRLYGSFLRIATIPIDQEVCAIAGPADDGINAAAKRIIAEDHKIAVRCLKINNEFFLYVHIDFFRDEVKNQKKLKDFWVTT